MSKKLFLLLIFEVWLNVAYSQTLKPKQQWELLKLALPPGEFKPQELRDLLSEVDYNSETTHKDLKIRRTGRFRDCLMIERLTEDGLVMVVSESVLLYFIQYQEREPSPNNKANPSQSSTYQVSLVSY
jgi:hypothetical protein